MQVEIIEKTSQPYAAIRAEIPMSELAAVLPQLWPEVFGWLAQAGVPIGGAPFIRYLEIQMPDGLLVEVGMPTVTLAVSDDRVTCGELPAGRFAATIHAGPYDGLMECTAQVLAWAQQQGERWDMTQRDTVESWGCRMESYLTDPSTEPDPQKWQTEVTLKLMD